MSETCGGHAFQSLIYANGSSVVTLKFAAKVGAPKCRSPFDSDQGRLSTHFGAKTHQNSLKDDSALFDANLGLRALLFRSIGFGTCLFDSPGLGANVREMTTVDDAVVLARS